VVILTLICVVILAGLLQSSDDLAFPANVSLALDVFQFVILMSILERLKRENPPPG